MDINVWKNNIREAVEDIADKKLQSKAWFQETRVVVTPEELYSSLFDDLLFYKFLTSSEATLNDTQKELGLKLYYALKQYSPDGAKLPLPRDMINDPHWCKIQEIANDFADSLSGER